MTTSWYPSPDPHDPRRGPGEPDGAADPRPEDYLPGPASGAGQPWAGPGPAAPAGQAGDWPGEPGQWWPAGSEQETAPWPAPPGQARPPGGRRPGRRGLLAAVAVLVFAAVAVTALAARPHGRPAPRAAAATGTALPPPGKMASRPAAAVPPPVTMTAARQVLAAYIAGNNAANQARSAARLGRIEGGSSYQLDAGGYRFLTAKDPANTGYQAFSFTAAAYYLPRLASYPRWFAVYGTWAGTRSAPFRGFLVFAQAAPRARWLDVLEPYVTAGLPAAAMPQAGADGTATAVPAGSAAGLAAAPGSLPAATAARLDGAAAPVTMTGLQAPGDQKDQAFWAARVPRGAGDTDRHYATPYGVYALRTRDGGALVFYSLAAVLTLTAPPGQTMGLQIPGYYSRGTPVSTATVPYADQFAARIGPHGSLATAEVLAQASGIAAGR